MASADLMSFPSNEVSFSHPQSTMPKRKVEPDAKLPETLDRSIQPLVPEVTFDPAKHLNFKPPPKVWSMKEIGLENVGIAPMAVSDPFPLFSEEAIQQMRSEVLSKVVMDNCAYSSNLSNLQLRGFAPK